MITRKLPLSPSRALAALLLVALVALLVAGCAGPGTSPAQTPLGQAERGAATAPLPRSGLPAILYQDLPRQAQDTIRLIEQDGPFPFERDGITFQNREGLLPNEPRGYYREYTVITPGSRDRGARRIVAGAEGELYYTDDHYESFREVIH